jgi:hypothetical protein
MFPKSKDGGPLSTPFRPTLSKGSIITQSSCLSRFGVANTVSSVSLPVCGIMLGASRWPNLAGYRRGGHPRSTAYRLSVPTKMRRLEQSLGCNPARCYRAEACTGAAIILRSAAM